MTQTGKPQVPAGDSFKLFFDVQDAQGAAIDLSLPGTTMEWSLTALPSSVVLLLHKELGTGMTVDGQVNGRLWVELYPEDTLDLPPGDYYQQVRIVFPLGNVATTTKRFLTILDTVP